MKPSDASDDLKTIVRKCLVVLGVPGILRDIERTIGAEALAPIEKASKQRGIFLECIKTMNLHSIKNKKGESYNGDTLERNAKQALQGYLDDSRVTGSLKINIGLACDLFAYIDQQMAQQEKKLQDKIKSKQAPDPQLLAEYRDVQVAREYAAVAGSQMHAMLECLRQTWRDKAGIKSLPTQAAVKKRRKTMSPTHVSEDERIACEKCLTVLGDEEARNSLYSYQQSALFSIVGETEQIRPKLLEAAGAEPFNIEMESDKAIRIIRKLLKDGSLPSEDRMLLATVRDRYNRIGASLAEQSDERIEHKDIREYAALVASQIDAVLCFLQKKEKTDPCNRALAALGDRETADILAESNDKALRLFVESIEERRTVFYDVLEREGINDMSLYRDEDNPVTFHFRDASLACLPLCRLRDGSGLLSQDMKDHLRVTSLAFEAAADSLQTLYDNKKRPDDVNVAIKFAVELKENINTVLDYVDRHETLPEEDKGRSPGW